MRWETLPVGWLVDVRPSSVDKKTNADEAPVRLCNYTDVYYADTIIGDRQFMEASATPDETRRFELRRDDVAITKDSETADDIGVPAWIGEDLPGVVLGYHTSLLRPRHIDGRFLFWVLMADTTKAYYEQAARGVTRFALRQQDVAATPVPVPPPEVQQRIADYLDTETARIDTLLAKNAEAAALAEERQLAVIVDRVTGGVEATPVGGYGSSFWINTKRSDWTICALGLRYRVELGKMLNAERADDPEGRAYLGNSNVRWDDFDLADVKTMTFTDAEWPRYGLEPGDVLVCEGGDVGRAAVWDGRVSGMHYQKALHRLRPLRPEDEPRYLMFALMAAARTGVFAIGSNKATIDHLTAEKLAEHRFPFPPLSEQREIVRDLDGALDASRSIRNKLERQRHLLRERRQAVITAAVTGEIDV